MSTSLVQTRPLRLKKTVTSGVAPKAQDENAMNTKAIAKKPVAATAAVIKRTAFGEITNVAPNVLLQKDSKKELLKPKEPIIPVASKKAILPQKSNFAIGMETETKLPHTLMVPEVSVKLESIVTDIFPTAVPMDEDEVHINKDLLLDEEFEVESRDDDEEIEDIDEQDIEDPKFCSEYVTEIMDYLFLKEQQDMVDSSYMEKQVEITDKHRTILVDWMSEVALKFKLLTETFFLSINIMDRFLQQKPVARTKLQLVGVTAMLIASKFEEIYTPEVKDFIMITAKTYSREEILKMERLILVTLDFNLGTPTCIHFLRRFSKAAKSESKVHTLSKYLVELSLLDLKLLNYSYSLIAAAAVYIARKMTEPQLKWNATLQHYCRYTEEQVLVCAKELNNFLKAQPESKVKAIYKKYASPKLLSVADMPAIDL